uniref:EF-hand domain-containing protein n=1 Tax=Alexandrium catenella TaxID=2925 RepID=A0A7S1MAX6_ALECA|mmetsp:Transcript_23042/g.62808  ORF Transcript_23042/g.62808 Transcript_23042/m.62808 type:complete len:599 (+) Transcript_23042:118-1914(+)
MAVAGMAATLGLAGEAASGLNPFPDATKCNNAQIAFLTGMYAYVLYQASQLISAGSELLLLVPQFAPIVGSIVLPILGAVPDGMMVLFSGLGDDAQSQVSVGVGALAGSTVMLLTLPWFAALVSGRVSINKKGVATYKRPAGDANKNWDKLDPPGNCNPFQTGVQWGSDIKGNTRMMLITLLGYVIIQGAAFTVDKLPKQKVITDSEEHYDIVKEAGFERNWALVGLIVCVLEFWYYLKDQWALTKASKGPVDDAIADANVQAMKEGKLTLRGAMAKFRQRNWSTLCQKGDLDQVLLHKESTDEVRRMCKVLAPFFAEYDLNGDNQIDFQEFRMIFKDVNEKLSSEAQWAMFDAADTDESGFISFEEFVACILSLALDPCNELKQDLAERRRTKVNPRKYLDDDRADDGEEDDGGDSSDDEEEDVPEDLADLAPEEQQKRIKVRSFKQMAMGTLLCLVFSDPMVDLLSEIGKRVGVSAFYISFVLAPIASNASELVSAYSYAKKRTAKSMTTALSCLVGAAVMNNTFCLGIFLALVYVKGLAWEFTAETLSIVFVQLMLGLMVYFRRGMYLYHGFIILSFYPLALALVWVLENELGWD